MDGDRWRSGWRGAVRTAVLDAWAVLAPTECSGCGAPDRGLCDQCRAAFAALTPRTTALPTGAGDGLPVWYAAEYAGRLRHALLAFKDGGRTDAASALARPLQVVLAAALAEVPAPLRGRVELAVIPSTRAAYRARGYAPVPLLLRRAGLRAARLLRPTRQAADQAGLGVDARRENRRNSLTASPASAGRVLVIVDDIVTTGATLLEADRAFRAAGATVLCAVALARTTRHRPSQETHRKREEITRDIGGERG